MRTIHLTVWVSLICTAMLLGASARAGAPLGNARQLVVVTTPDWNDIHGKLYRYERSKIGWTRVGEPFSVVIGRKGLGWGLGTVSSLRKPGDPVKQEGDGRSPAGVFPIGAGFGYDSQKPDWMKLPYIPLTSATECVDDAKSEYYNAVVDRVATLKPDWDSSEKMRSIDVYRWGVVVNQNAAHQRSGGSCIFLHIWHGPERPTAGCTAMEESQLEELIRWLDPSANPSMVALPQAEYDRLRSEWQLP